LQRAALRAASDDPIGEQRANGIGLMSIEAGVNTRVDRWTKLVALYAARLLMPDNYDDADRLVLAGSVAKPPSQRLLEYESRQISAQRNGNALAAVGDSTMRDLLPRLRTLFETELSDPSVTEASVLGQREQIDDALRESGVSEQTERDLFSLLAATEARRRAR